MEGHSVMSGTTVSPDALAAIYMDVIEKDLGLVASQDADNDVVFKMMDFGTFILSLDAERDPEYFMLVFPNFASTNDENLMKDFYHIANDANRTKKAVKISLRDTDDGLSMTATVEAFLAGADQAPSKDIIKATLGRYISSIRSGVRSVAEEIEKKKAEGKKAQGAKSM